MSYHLLPIFYLFSSLVPHSKLPIVPISDVEEIVVENPKVKCVSGCDLVASETDAKKFKCLKVDDKDVAGQSDPLHFVTLSNYHFQCRTNVVLPGNVNIIIRYIFLVFVSLLLYNLGLPIRALDCKFSDQEDKMFIFDSCVITYSFVKYEKINKVDDSSLWYLLVVILMLLILLAVKEVKRTKLGTVPKEPTSAFNDIMDVKEAVKDIDESSEARRQERMFKPMVSLFKDRRTRSRSRRR